MHLFQKYDWESAAKTPKFKTYESTKQEDVVTKKNWWTVFKLPSNNRRTALIIDIRKMTPDGEYKKFTTEHYGWTVYPLFTPDSYAPSGVF